MKSNKTNLRDKTKVSLLVVTALVMILTMIPSTAFAVSSSAPHMAELSSVKRTAPTSTSIKISWKKARNADGYSIYRAASKTGDYKRIHSTKKLSYTDKKLRTGKTYYYKVRSYRYVKGNRTYALASMPKSLKMTYIHPILKVHESFGLVDNETVGMPYGITVTPSDYDETVYLITSIERPFYKRGKLAAVLCKDAAVKSKDQRKRVYFKYVDKLWSYDPDLKVESTGKKKSDFQYIKLLKKHGYTNNWYPITAGIALEPLPGSNKRHMFEDGDMIKFYVMYRDKLYVVKYDKINGVRTEITN